MLSWNVALLALEVGLVGWAHVVVGLTWTTIGLAFAALVAFGVALMTYTIRVHVPRTLRRHQALLQAHLAATTLAAEDHRDEVVDGQSTPHSIAPSHVAPTTPQVSRAR